MFGDPIIGSEKYPLKILADVCNLIQDGEHTSVKRVDGGNLFISSRNIKANHDIVLDAVSYISDDDFARIQKRFNPTKGDIIITCAGTIGNSAVVPEMQPFVADRGIALLRPNYTVINTRYLHACIKSMFLQKQMQSSVHATALAHLYLNKIKTIRLIFPPMELQEQFSLLDEQLDKSKVVGKMQRISLEKIAHSDILSWRLALP